MKRHTVLHLNLLVFFATISSHVFGFQEKTADTLVRPGISGYVEDPQHRPLPLVVINLLRERDSTVAGSVISDTSGKFHVAKAPEGIFIIKVTMVGYLPGWSKAFQFSPDSSVDIGAITLQPEPGALQAVEVTASKPFVERKNDRFILNVANSAMATGNATQLLRVAPFVEVSPTNDISLQGKRTLILIDNRQVPQESVKDILQAMPAGNIQKVELITTPSAKYEGAYGAVINIVTKKKETEGITGSLRAEGGIGKYKLLDVDGSLTYKHKKLTLHGIGSYGWESTLYFDGVEKILSAQGTPDVLTNNLSQLTHSQPYTFQIGMDLDLGKNQSIGFVVDATATKGAYGPAPSVNYFSKYDHPVDSILYTGGAFHKDNSTVNYAVNYHLLTDSGRQELSLLTTYTPYSSKLIQNYPSVLMGPQMDTIRVPSEYRTDNRTNVYLFISQGDYGYTFRNKLKFEAGLKYQTIRSHGVIGYQDYENGSFVQVPAYSSDNKVTETIYGGYGILSGTIGKHYAQLGLRMEETNAEYAGQYTQRYFKLFPTVSYTYNFNDNHAMTLSYKRSIRRTPYGELLPYIVFTNQYNAWTGNPGLKPQYDNTLTLSANIHKVNLSLRYTSVEGLFAGVPSKQDIDTKVTYFSLINMNRSSDIALDVFYPIKVTGWWDMQTSGSFIGYSTTTGQVLGRSFTLSSAYFNAQTDQTFTVTPKLKLEIVGWYYTARARNLTKYGGFGNIYASVLWKVMHGRGEIRLSGYNILKEITYHYDYDFGAYTAHESQYITTRRVGLGFTYNFGKSKISAPDKKFGNEDALQRLNK